MPTRQEVEFLRTRAQRMREIARIDTAISPELIQMAEELEAHADRLGQPASDMLSACDIPPRLARWGQR